MSELAKAFDPKEAEKKWYPFWEHQGFFLADAHSKKPPFTIIIPPPNVTGVLHMGHALVDTLQDVLIRFKRMLGFEINSTLASQKLSELNIPEILFDHGNDWLLTNAQLGASIKDWENKQVIIIDGMGHQYVAREQVVKELDEWTKSLEELERSLG